jgi:hypothetical protein
VQGVALGGVEGGEDRLVRRRDGGAEPGDELGALGGGVDALAALVARLGAALDQAARLEPLEQAGDAGGAGPGDRGDVSLDRAGVLRQVAEDEGLLVAEPAAADPLLAGTALLPGHPADQVEGRGELGCVHGVKSKR